MNKCERCNVDVFGNKYCPLCGKYIAGKNEVEREYPASIKRRTNKTYTLRVIFGLLVVLNFLTIAIELMISKNFYFSWHVLVPSLLLYIFIYFPLKRNWSFLASVCIAICCLSGYIIFLEYFTKSSGWGLNYVVPLFLFACEVTCFLILAITKFEKIELQMPIILSSSLSLACFLFVYLTRNTYWPSAISLLFGFTAVFTIFIVKSRRAKKNLQKSFHV